MGGISSLFDVCPDSFVGLIVDGVYCKEGTFHCNQCGVMTCEAKNLIEISSDQSLDSRTESLAQSQKETLIQSFRNPDGHIFKLLVVREGTVKADGGSILRNTWFRGYGWTVAFCTGCGIHLGWLFKKELTLSLKLGDLRASFSDAICCAIRDSLDMSDSGDVSRCLLKTCGSQVQKELKRKDISQTGIVSTSAPNLLCEKIYFISLDKFDGHWDTGTAELLKQANADGMRSVALPLFGAGSLHQRLSAHSYVL